MTCGGGRSATRQNELLQRRQRVIESVARLLHARNPLCRDDLIAGTAQVTSEIEQLMLDLGEKRRHVCGQSRYGQQYTDHAVELIHRSVGLDALSVFGHARAITETGGPVISGTCVDFAEAV